MKCRLFLLHLQIYLTTPPSVILSHIFSHRKNLVNLKITGKYVEQLVPITKILASIDVQSTQIIVSKQSNNKYTK